MWNDPLGAVRSLSKHPPATAWRQHWLWQGRKFAIRARYGWEHSMPCMWPGVTTHSLLLCRLVYCCASFKRQEGRTVTLETDMIEEPSKECQGDCQVDRAAHAHQQSRAESYGRAAHVSPCHIQAAHSTCDTMCKAVQMQQSRMVPQCI